ncbi:thioredoxin domain-containing protein [Lentisalinibacter sediminis]
MNYRINHNPRCSRSRATLALLEEAGVSVTVTEYPEEPPDTATLLRSTELLRCRPRDLIRRNDAAASGRPPENMHGNLRS